MGLGTRVSGTQLDISQGSAVSTGRSLDVAIQGNGLFGVKTLPNQGDGLAYTRTGKFFVNPNGDIVLNSSDGYKLDPPINVGTNAVSVDVTTDGRVFVTQPGTTTPTEVGQIQLATFVNPQGLKQIGGNLYQARQPTPAAPSRFPIPALTPPARCSRASSKPATSIPSTNWWI